MTRQIFNYTFTRQEINTAVEYALKVWDFTLDGGEVVKSNLEAIASGVGESVTVTSINPDRESEVMRWLSDFVQPNRIDWELVFSEV